MSFWDRTQSGLAFGTERKILKSAFSLSSLSSNLRENFGTGGDPAQPAPWVKTPVPLAPQPPRPPPPKAPGPVEEQVYEEAEEEAAASIHLHDDEFTKPSPSVRWHQAPFRDTAPSAPHSLCTAVCAAKVLPLACRRLVVLASVVVLALAARIAPCVFLLLPARQRGSVGRTLRGGQRGLGGFDKSLLPPGGQGHDNVSAGADRAASSSGTCEMHQRLVSRFEKSKIPP